MNPIAPARFQKKDRQVRATRQFRLVALPTQTKEKKDEITKDCDVFGDIYYGFNIC